MHKRLRFLLPSFLSAFAVVLVAALPTAGFAAPPHEQRAAAQAATWSGWTSMGVPSGFVRAAMPSVGVTADGRLELFVTSYTPPASGPGPDACGIYSRRQTAPGGSWTDWAQFGDCLQASPYVAWKILPYVASNADGTLQVFAESLQSDPLNPGMYRLDIVYNHQQAGPNPDQWSDWTYLGSPPGSINLSSPIAAQDASGRLTVFAFGSDGDVWTTQQAAAGVDTWSAWQSLGTPTGAFQSPQVQQNVDGRLELFEWGSGNHIYNSWQTEPSGSWAGWGDLGGPSGIAGEFSVGQNADGRLEVFVTDFSQLWHRWQLGWGFWSDWDSLGKPSGVNVSLPHVAQLRTGELLALAVGDDGALWAIQQKPTRDSWGNWFSLGKPSASLFRAQWDYNYTAVQRPGGGLSIFATAEDGAVWRLDQQWSLYEPLLRRP